MVEDDEDDGEEDEDDEVQVVTRLGPRAKNQHMVGLFPSTPRSMTSPAMRRWTSLNSKTRPSMAMRNMPKR